MYQKAEADTSLVPSKESSFMDRMYMKIEAICVEADKNPSLLFQEAGKYFETQVANAGATVRKVCSEFIRDLLPEDECKHIEKCQCRCEASKKKQEAAAAKEPQIQTNQISQDQDGNTQPDRIQQSPKTQELVETTPVMLQAEESDTVVEAGDQVAQWYITDEYKRSSGILENWEITAVSTSKEESDSDWEML